MTRICLALVCAALSFVTFSETRADNHELLNAADLRRPSMPVADLDASVTFFTDVLGFEEGGRQVYNSPILRTVLGAPEGVDITVVALNDRNQQGALVLYSAPGTQIDAAANTANATTLSLLTDDIQRVFEQAVKGGYEIILTPMEAAAMDNFPPEEEMILVEPSGHRLIVIQPPPAE